MLGSFDPFAQVLLWPALVAARGRAASFTHWTNGVGMEFNAECHYLENVDMDGYAGGNAGSYYLSVCGGVAYGVFDLFSFAFSFPTFFPSIGDATLESVERVKSREKPLGYGFFRSSITKGIDFEREVVPPRCPIRSLASLYFAGMALDMIWTHELSHGVHGHIDFAQSNLGIRAMSERPMGDGDLLLMPMEAEADRFAILATVQTAMTGNKAPYLPLKLSNLSNEIRVTAALVVVALLSWFWASQQRIDRHYDGIDPYAQGTHPPPLVRLHLSFEMARQFLAMQGWSTSKFENVVFEAMSNLEALSSANSWFSILDPARAFSDEANSHVKDVKAIMGDSFRQIEGSLEPFRFVRPQPSSEHRS